VRVQFDHGRQLNLLQEAPDTDTFEQLTKLASNRKNWKKLTLWATRKYKPRSATTTTNTHYSLRSNANNNNTEVANAPATAGHITTSDNTLPLYPIFGGPPLKKKKPKQKGAKKKKQKETGLTDMQRAAWAHAHFILNHGTAADAARLLTHKNTIKHTPAATLREVQAFASAQVPTWEVAAAEVFSSSGSSAESMDTSETSEPESMMSPRTPRTLIPAIPTTGTPYQPPAWMPKAPADRFVDATTNNGINEHSAVSCETDTDTDTIQHTPTIQGHHYSTHIHNTHTPPIHLNLSPIHMNEQNNYTHFECLPKHTHTN
jgi:hypothetical protein